MQKYTPWLIIIGLAIWGFHNCERKEYYRNTGTENALALSDSVQYYKNRSGSQTAAIRALQLSKEEFREIIIKKDKELAVLAKEFAQIRSVVKFDNAITFDSIGIKFDTPLIHPIDTVMRFERSGKIAADWYTLGYRVTNDSLLIAPFETWTSATVLTGFKRKWLLGRETLTTDITNSNPHITVTSITSAEVSVRVPWYKKWYVWLAAGIVSGIVVK